jgi:hypothetical protein
MDPFIDYCSRDSTSYPSMKYDDSFFWHKDQLPIQIETVKQEDPREYVDGKLLIYYQNISGEAFLSSTEQIALEWANPLTTIQKYLPTADDFNLKVLKSIFGLDQVILVIPENLRLTDIFKNHFLKGTSPKNIIIRTPDVLDSYWVHLVYLMSKLFDKVTLLQPICLKSRYLICMNYVGDDSISLKDLSDIVSSDLSSERVYGFFKTLPDMFVSWITFMNNSHLYFRSEFMIHVVEARTALTNSSFYWPGTSYDVLKAVRFIAGIPTDPRVNIPPGLKFTEEIDIAIVTKLHLYGKPEDFSKRPLHKTVDMEKDDKMPYAPLKGARKAGTGWGQRKLLMSEMDAMIEMIGKDESVLVVYIGAAPWKHGIVLMNWFSNARFLLVDPREDDWDPEVLKSRDDVRLSIRSAFFDKEMAQEIVTWFEPTYNGPMKRLVSGVKKVLFFSDIRSSIHGELGYVAAEFGVHSDMNFQKEMVEILYQNLRDKGVTVLSWLKFRLPFIMEIGGSDYNYGKGELHLQPWAPIGSTELRLWWNPADGETSYNKKVIEEIMMFHNDRIRSADYGESKFADYCPCHDCHYEIDIIWKYLAKFKEISIGADIDPFKLHLEEIVKIMGKTLAAHSKMDRRQASVPQAIRSLSPLLENIRSNVLIRLKNQWKTLLEKKKDLFKNVDLSKLIDDFMIAHLFLFGGFFVTNLEKKVEIFTEIFGLETVASETVSKIIEELAGINNVVMTAYKAELQKYKEQSSNEPVAVLMKKLRKGGMFNLVLGETKTLGFHKSILFKFLIPKELNFNITEETMKGLTKSVLPRAYSILKRYGTVQSNHFYLYPGELFKSYEVLRNGRILGLSVLSANRDDKFMLLDFKLDQYFTDDKYTNILLETEKIKILDGQNLTVFLPPIKALWVRALKILLPLLDKYNNEDKSIVLLVHSSVIPAISEMIKRVKKEEKNYTGFFLNTLTNEPLKAENYTIILLGNEYSTLKL